MNSLDAICAALDGSRIGDRVMAKCPAHDDRNPSLSVKEGSNGVVLVHCFAGCAQDSVIGALRDRGLWSGKQLTRTRAVSKGGLNDTPANDLIPPPAGVQPPADLGKAHWIYRGAAGETLFLIERIDTSLGKQFRPHSWSKATQSWVNRAWPAPRPLYGLHRLAQRPDAEILIVEGEKAAVAARQLVGDRYIVLTWANGANAVATADWSVLKGRSVTIWPDADAPGLKAAKALCEILKSSCPVVRLIDVDPASDDVFAKQAGFDAADALLLGWTFEGLNEWAGPKTKTIWAEAKFESVAESVADAADARKVANANKCNTGIRYLDKALGGGIATGDVLILSAASGAGKTETALFIATHNAAQGRRVHFFALEAERYELTQRLLYREIANLYFASKTARLDILGQRLNFADWMDGKFGVNVQDFERSAEASLREKHKSLFVYYRDKEFGIEELTKQVLAIKDKTDLIVLDHFHYMDVEGDNENRAMSDMVKSIRDIALICQKPFVVVAHVRKRDMRSRSLLPDLDDIHGTSNLSKIATKAVMLGPCHEASQRPGEYYTYMRVVKNRRDGSRCRYTAVCTFDASRNAYKDEFILGRLSADGQKFEPLKPEEMPHWVKG